MIPTQTLALLAAILFVPIGVVYVSRKRPSPLRAVAVMATAIYLAIVVGVTLGPLPVDGGFEPGFTGESVEMNLVPFKTIGRYFTEGVSPDLTTRQVGGNLLLLMPLGFLLPIVSRAIRSLGRVLSVALVVSVGIEILQVLVIITVGNAGRAIDVDDVILNAAGAAVGWLAWRLMAPAPGGDGGSGEVGRTAPSKS